MRRLRTGAALRVTGLSPLTVKRLPVPLDTIPLVVDLVQVLTFTLPSYNRYSKVAYSSQITVLWVGEQEPYCTDKTAGLLIFAKYNNIARKQ